MRFRLTQVVQHWYTTCMTARILFVDDEYERHAKFAAFRGRTADIVHVTNAGAALFALNDSPFTEIWLDHDMGDDGRGNVLDIKPVVTRLLERPVFGATIRIHSWNAVAATRMETDLRVAGYEVVWAPFNYGKGEP